jgi:hypothetical protein
METVSTNDSNAMEVSYNQVGHAQMETVSTNDSNAMEVRYNQVRLDRADLRRWKLCQKAIPMLWW